MASAGKARKGWAHPTHQRTKDEAKQRLGPKSRIVHVRVSDAEYAAITRAMEAAGTKKLSLFVRSILLGATGEFMDARQQELEAEAAPRTQTAVADAASLDKWLFEQEQSEAPRHVADIDALAPAAVAPEAPPPVQTLPIPVVPPIVALEPSQAPSRPSPSPVTPDIAGKASRNLLAEFREIMGGDEQHVGASVRVLLDGGPKAR